MDVQDVAVACVNRGDDERLAVGDEPHVADQSFIENRIDGFAVVSTSLGQTANAEHVFDPVQLVPLDAIDSSRVTSRVPERSRMETRMPAVRRRSVAVSLALAALIGGACSTPTASTSPATQSPSARDSSPKATPARQECKNAPVKAKFHYTKRVLTADRAFVQKVSKQAISYYAIKTSDCIERDAVDVWLENRTGGKVLAVATYGEIRVFTKSRAWELAVTAERAQVLFHEWYHVLQRTLTATRALPLWLVEGAAEWVGFDAAVQFGYIENMDLIRPFLSRDAERPSRPIQKAQSLNAGVYSLYFMGVDFLLRHHGGSTRLRQFWKTARPGESWKKAFRSVFHVDPAAFLEKFEAYRAAGFTE